MAKENLNNEEKKEKWKKILKIGIGVCAVGFSFILVGILYQNYKNNQSEKLKLSSDRNKYYKEAYEVKDRDDVSDEFFSEMFLSADEWYETDSKRSVELTDSIKELKGDLSMGVFLYNTLRYVEVDCETSFEDEMNLYAEFLGKVNEKLWSKGENQDIVVRLYSSDGEQIVLYYDNGKKYMDYNFFDKEKESKWESVKATNKLSQFENVDYEEVVIDEDTIIAELDRFGTLIPFVTDEIIKAYNERKQIKIVFNSEKYLGYDYIDESEKNTIIDGNYSNDLQEVVDNGDIGEESVLDKEVDVENNLTPLNDLDYNTKKDVYLSPDDYCRYAENVEDNELNYNTHIKIGEVPESEKTEEDYYLSKSWICVFCSSRLFRDIDYIRTNLESTNISYQLMYYLFQTEAVSYDLGTNIQNIIEKFL